MARASAAGPSRPDPGLVTAGSAHGAMGTNSSGLPISSADDEVAAALCRFEHDFQWFLDGAADVVDLAEREPRCVLAQIYAAAIQLYSQAEPQITAGARPLLARASQLLDGATDRERALFTAVDAWARFDLGAAATAFQHLVDRWPQDVAAVKLAEFVFFEAPDYPRHLRLMETAAPANASLPYFGAMHAFAHELNGHYDEALRLAENAVADEPDTPWAHHALGHLYLNTGRIAEGTAALTGFAPGWDGHNQGIRAHNAWHLALLHLAAMDLEATLGVYRSHIAQVVPDSVFEHTDEISLLWRLELVGHPVGPELWAPLLPYARERAGDIVAPFLNAHYVYALTRAGEGRTARRAIELVSQRVDAGRDPWRTGLPLLHGVAALAEDDLEDGLAALEPIRGTLRCVGGSDAQNDLFSQATIVALARSGRADRAAALVRERTAGRRPTPQEQTWLAIA